jgi:FKBP-type peptidyl-prolyl cis-trans isomerase
MNRIVCLTLLALLLAGTAGAQTPSLTPEQTKALVAISDGTTTTPSGLRYKILTPGTGAQPQKGQTITAEYVGKFLDGTVFDASANHPAAFQFAVGTGQVIKGWDEAFASMKKGEKRLLIVPPELGYGAAGMGTAIPANSWLVFEVELVGIRG